MQNLETDNYKALLSDYVAPPEDDGFSDAILKKVQADKPSAMFTWRKSLISLAAFMGGVIAAQQFPALSKMSNKALALIPPVDLPTPMLFDPSVYTWLGLSLLVLFALWSLLDPLIDM